TLSPDRAAKRAESVGPASVGPESVGPESVGPEPLAPDLAGPELARAALDAALARRTVPPRRQAVSPRRAGGPRRLRGYSGAGPDPRDPQPLRAVIDRLVKARGWQRPAAEARVFGAWEKVAGADVAAHSRPVKLEDGELT